MAGIALRYQDNRAEAFAKLDRWTEGVVGVALPRTLNKVLDQAQVAGLRKVNQIYGVGPRSMERYLTTRLAKQGDLEAVLTAKGAGFPLYLFQPRQTKKGVTVKLKGRRVLIPHAFIARMKSGHVGVFARGGYGGKAKNRPTGETSGRFHFGKDRLSINELFTFGPPQAIRNPAVVDAMNDRAREQLPIVLKQEIRFASR